MTMTSGGWLRSLSTQLHRALVVFVLALGLSPTLPAQTNPNTGPGGPVLVVTSTPATFSRYYAEILRAEGLNAFAVADVGSVNSSLLSNYDVVLLGKVSLSGSQVTALTNWVNGGGNLIAMDPDSQLASLLGITMTASTISNGYLLVDTTTKPGNGIVGQTMQFHGSARLFTLNGASRIATLYTNATTPTTNNNPAVTLRSVGSNGGQTAAFAYDLATSIVYTRQGNPAWATQERDGLDPVRSNDKFYGPSASDPQQNWIDLNKVSIPQADEQQRLLANLIQVMNRDRKPLPRFWYFPNGHRAVLLMSGDDHARGGTLDRFNQFLSLSTPGCNVSNWECIRGTSYIYPNTPMSDAQAAAFNAQGFEISVHINTVCENFTQSSLTNTYDNQLLDFNAAFPSLPDPVTQRHHCIVWSDWASGAKVQLAHGMRLDTSYYYWPSPWVNNVPGHFTGSAMPMRFADLDGTLIDVYQAVTQMTDESGQQYPFTVDALLDKAIGPEEQYGVYTINAHTDLPTMVESDTAVASAQARGVPVVTAKQMLTWLDGRNRSTFGSIAYSSNNLTFSVTGGTGSNGLRGMIPRYTNTRVLNTLRRGSTDVSFEIVTVKGIEYASFPATNGNYTAAYIADTTAPTVVARTPASGATNVPLSSVVTATFSEAIDPSTVTSGTMELRTSTNALVPSTITYDPATFTARLTPNSPLSFNVTYTVTVRGGSTDPRIKDQLGNPLAANAVWSFATAPNDGCPCSAFPPNTVPGTPATTDSNAVELGVKFRASTTGNILGVRFYKGAGNSGPHVGNLWTSSGQLLATATFTNETDTGWQTVTFPSPVPISANTVYIASYHAPAGRYAVDQGFFASAVTNGNITLLSSSESGGNGVYRYGQSSSFPDSSWNASNYYVDVLFSTGPGPQPDTTAPTVTIDAPTTNATYSAPTSSLNVGGTASDNVGVTQVTWANNRGGSGTAVGTASWSVSGIQLLGGTNVITITARDAANNTGTDVLTVTFASDSTAPTITGRTPAVSATGVSINTTVTATFNEALDPATVNTNTLQLRTPSNAIVPATVTYNNATFVATLTPTAPLSPSTTYGMTIRGGGTDPRVKDVSGNALAANATWSFTTASDACPCSIWDSLAAPVVASDPDGNAVELGVRFRADVSGNITGIRFYKGAANTGTHTGRLWTNDGTLLGTVTFQNETASGWQQANFTTPIAITANTTYVASYHAPNGKYAADGNFFLSSGVVRAPLRALQSGVDGLNGVYRYGAGGQFPNESFQGANYWVDVAFETVPVGPDTTPPTVTSHTPPAGASNVATGTAVNVTFSEAMQASTITTSTVELRNPSNVLVAATVTYNSSTFTATLVPNSALATSTTYTATVRGGGTDPRVKDAAGNALASNLTWTFTTAAPGGTCAVNAITAENCLTGSPSSEWDISGAGDPSIQGYATQISVNRGTTVQFKVDTNATNYRFDIYRMGYYGGLGARKVTTVNPSATLPQNQPDCLVQSSTGLIDCGNWAVSGSWAVPSTATSGIYFAKVVRTDTGGASHIFFIVRNDAGAADLVFQTSDTTWQAYNNYGGNSLYVGSPGTNPARAYKVSYNRPFNTRAVDNGQDWVFNAEYPMVRWLEANGYNVTYITGVDTDRNGALLTSRKAFLSVGHDEYWSAQQRTNVEAARAAGVHLAFFSGNEVFWKTRWENSIDGSGTTYRTLVSYKETHANAKIDPTATWTGTWRDPRFSPPADGNRPENALTGQIFAVNSGTSGIVVPAEDGKMRFWRLTNIASQSSGSISLPNGTLGYEWDIDPNNGSRPAGAFRLSSATVSGVDLLQDHGSSYSTGTATHNMTLYKHSSGALVFGAGTVQWSWGLDATHDRAGTPSDSRMQQATVNLFADMTIQPGSLQSGLQPTSSSTDSTRPASVITAPTAGATVPLGVPLTITGTATDSGGVVGGVEVSTDNGTTWRPAIGRGSWTFSWTPSATGSVTIRTRAVDDSGNIETPTAGRTVTVGSGGGGSCPCTIWGTATPPGSPDTDIGPVELGTRFRPNVNGRVTAIRFYKNSANTGTHVGRLWSNTGTLLASVTFTGESASGWQTMNLPTPVNVTANTYYVVSYNSSTGSYIGQDSAFATNGIANGQLYAPRDGEVGSNGLFKYGPSGTFPTDSWMSEAYWVDVVFTNP